MVGCESDTPEQAEAVLRQVLLAPAPLDEDHLDRVRRRFLGGYVRSFESVRAQAFAHAYEAIEDVPPFAALQRVQSLTLAEVQARQHELLREENLAVAVTQKG